jgi:hypothetical protein
MPELLFEYNQIKNNNTKAPSINSPLLNNYLFHNMSTIGFDVNKIHAVF